MYALGGKPCHVSHEFQLHSSTAKFYPINPLPSSSTLAVESEDAHLDIQIITVC